MSLPTPLTVLRVVTDGVKSFLFAIATLMVVLPLAQLVVGLVGLGLVFAHHWLIGGVLIVVAVVARWIRSNIRI